MHLDASLSLSEVISRFDSLSGFQLVRRRHSWVAIFQDVWGDAFYRIGPKDVLAKDIETHLLLSQSGFPVPALLHQSQWRDWLCYSEKRAGDMVFGDRFRGLPSGSSEFHDAFLECLSIVRQYFWAQSTFSPWLRNIGERELDEIFSTNGVYAVLDESMADTSLMDCDFAQVQARLKCSLMDEPTEFSHGDFNAMNVLAGWVIDFEKNSISVCWYDAASFLIHQYAFPEARARQDYGIEHFSSIYLLTDDQIGEYVRLYESSTWRRFDEIFDRAFILKACWHSGDLFDRPALRKFRYDWYRPFFRAYSEGQPLLPLFRSFATERFTALFS